MLAPWLDVDATDWALFLDIDGTVLPIQPRPERVRADRELHELLGRLYGRLQGALALVSGRNLADIDRIFAPHQFSAAGGHGSEVRLAGEHAIESDLPTLTPAVIRGAQRLFGSSPGLLLERKRHGLAVHYRGAPEARARVRSWIAATANEHAGKFQVVEGKMVCELVASGVDKGAAIRRLMAREPFRHRKPIFVGDDVPDELGFAATNEHGGVSIRVGGGGRSAATENLASVTDLRRWLAKSFLD